MSGFPLKPISALAAVSSYVYWKYLLGGSTATSLIASFIFAWITQVFFWIVWKVFLYPIYFSPLRHFPSPEGSSWWNGQYANIVAVPTGKPMLRWINKIPNNGIIRYLGLLNSERLFITSPNALREVLNTQSYEFAKPSQVVESLSRLLGNGVLFAEGSEHKKQRRDLTPAFAFRHIKELYPGFWKKSVESVEAITQEVQAGGIKYEDLPDFQKEQSISQGKTSTDAVIEVCEWASRVTLDIIGVAGMGHDFGAVQDSDTPLNQTYRKVFKPSRQAQILALLGTIFPGWLVSKIPVKRNGEVEEAAGTIRDVCKQLLRKKKENREKNQMADVDILSVALESGGFTEESLVDQMMTFLAAGHDTTATALTWAIYELCANPSYQTRLRAEIRDNLPSPSSSEPVTSAQIDHLPYLNAICSEVLRYHPPVSLTMRDAIHDTTLLGHRVPKGTRIVLCPEAVNKSEALWGPDAMKFNPDRWMPSSGNPSPANGGAASNYALLTFIHGPRSCIGQSFSRSEFACLLAAWIGRFEFSLNDERELDERNIVIKGGVTCKPSRGLYVKTKVIDGW
ncbi:Cytochrome P450 monooxygenase [Podosphaera aphanis]|nr:Cytochrome P450 monooxygenase [Podosphaera aphanis]